MSGFVEQGAGIQQLLYKGNQVATSRVGPAEKVGNGDEEIARSMGGADSVQPVNGRRVL